MIFCSRMREKKPTWLTMLGTSGTGKTYLARNIITWAEPRLNIGWAKSVYWPNFCSKMKTGKFDVNESVENITSPKLVLIDEIGLGTDTRDFGMDLLLRVLQGRLDKFTIITSNLTPKGIGKLDQRILSRLERNGTIVTLDTIQFHKRI